MVSILNIKQKMFFRKFIIFCLKGCVLPPYIKPFTKRKPHRILLHVGTNDLTNQNIDTVENLRQIRKTMKEELPNCELILSTCVKRGDRKGIDKKVEELNGKVKDFCRSTNLNFIEHDNITEKHLGKRKLHLNARGKAIL